MKFTEPLLLFVGAFASLGMFVYIAHLIYRASVVAEEPTDVTALITGVLAIGVILWFIMIMRALWLIVNPNSTPVQTK